MHSLGERGDHALHGFGPFPKHLVAREQGTVDERDFKVDQTVDEVKAVAFGADIQGRSNEDGLNDVADHGLIALRLTAADGMNSNVIGSQAELPHDLP